MAGNPDPDLNPLQQPRAACSSILNTLLRKPFREPGVYERWIIHDPKSPINPKQGAKLEADHFFEIQHIVDLLFSEGALSEDPNSPNYVYYRPLGQFVELAVHVSDGLNLFSIDSDTNQKKRKIKYFQYPPGPNQSTLIRDYMKSHAVIQKTGEIRVVEHILRDFAQRMAMWPAQEKPLVRVIGRKLCTDFHDLGWDHPLVMQ